MAAVILAWFLLATGAGVRAETATVDEMQQVCRNWLTYVVSEKGSWSGQAVPSVADVHEIVVNDTLLARCFTITPSGYVVVPVLKELPPIKACSEDFGLDVNETGGIAQLLRDVLLNRMRNYVILYGDPDAVGPSPSGADPGRAHREQWDRFLLSDEEFAADLRASKSAPMDQVGPLLTTIWGQGSPYNNYCPWGDGNRCVVGCVATAAVQILNYHQWPQVGFGTHTYWWNGDYSCEGSSPGQWLTADFTNDYDWDNMPNNCMGGCTPEQEAALAELSYEAGVAFNMNYGVCGSGTWASMSEWITHFRYRDVMNMTYRDGHSLSSWFNIIQQQINANQPMEYYIHSHAIVCDGWRDPAGLKQYHMNYGWDGSQNSWFTLDSLHCPWEGCDPMVESMVRDIIPNRGVMFGADTTFGWVPFDVFYTGSSEFSVSQWQWDFGDGLVETVFVETLTHTYETSGLFDVSLAVDTGGDTLSMQRQQYVIALADSVITGDVGANPGDTVEMTVYACNAVPLTKLLIPFQIEGTIGSSHGYGAFSTIGCRTTDFETQTYIHFDPGNGSYTIKLETSSSELPPGDGAVLKLYLVVSPSAVPGQQDTLLLAGYSSYLPLFSGNVAEYNPVAIDGIISLSCCIGMRGNIDGSVTEASDVGDLTYLVSYLFQGGPAPPCTEEADTDASGSVDVADLTCMIGYLFQGSDCIQPCY
ncbi:MAG: C10 family peptidase [bacterium]